MSDRVDRSAEDLPGPGPSTISPEVVRSFRSQLTRGEDVVDPSTWAGSIPQVQGIAPRVRIGRSRWFNLLWLLPIGFVLLLVAVAAAKGLRNMPSVERFIVRYPGTIESASAKANPGPADLGRSAALLQPVPVDLHHPVRSADPQRPSPAVLDAAQHSRQGLVPRPEAGSRPSRCGRRSRTPSACRDRSDCPGSGTRSAWPAGGISGPIPSGCSTVSSSTSCCSRPVSGAGWCPPVGRCFPTLLSVLIQYLSLHWPTENGWVAYNSLQLLAYFITIFVAAPLALITGLGHVAGAVHPLQADQQGAQHSDGPIRCTSWCWSGSCSSS